MGVQGGPGNRTHLLLNINGKFITEMFLLKSCVVLLCILFVLITQGNIFFYSMELQQRVCGICYYHVKELLLLNYDIFISK